MSAWGASFTEAACRPEACPIASCMSVVSVFAQRREARGSVHFLRRPRELAPHRAGRAPLVGLDDVGQGHRLAAVAFADRLVVGQIDADRHHRAGLPGPHHHVDRVGDDALDAGLAVVRIPGHVVLEPLRVVGQLADPCGRLLVDVEDEAFPAALDTARVHVDLDEPVDGVDRRGLVLHPRDVELLPVGLRAGPVELHQRGQRLGRGLAGNAARGLEVLDDLRNLTTVPPVGPVDFFNERAAGLHQARVEAVFLRKPLQVGHRDAGVEVVGAGEQDVLAEPDSCW